MDGRYAVLRVIEEGRALDRANDVVALAHEGYRHLDASHRAQVGGQQDTYLLEAIECAEALGRIRDTAKAWAADVTTAIEISPDQLPLALAA